MDKYTITLARHTGQIKDEVTECDVNRMEFARITGNEYLSIGSDVYVKAEQSDNTAVYMSIHPLRLSLSVLARNAS